MVLPLRARRQTWAPSRWPPRPPRAGASAPRPRAGQGPDPRAALAWTTPGSYPRCTSGRGPAAQAPAAHAARDPRAGGGRALPASQRGSQVGGDCTTCSRCPTVVGIAIGDVIGQTSPPRPPWASCAACCAATPGAAAPRTCWTALDQLFSRWRLAQLATAVYGGWTLPAGARSWTLRYGQRRAPAAPAAPARRQRRLPRGRALGGCSARRRGTAARRRPPPRAAPRCCCSPTGSWSVATVRLDQGLERLRPASRPARPTPTPTPCATPSSGMPGTGSDDDVAILALRLDRPRPDPRSVPIGLSPAGAHQDAERVRGGRPGAGAGQRQRQAAGQEHRRHAAERAERFAAMRAGAAAAAPAPPSARAAAVQCQAGGRGVRALLGTWASIVPSSAVLDSPESSCANSSPTIDTGAAPPAIIRRPRPCPPARRQRGACHPVSPRARAANPR